jgi:transposase
VWCAPGRNRATLQAFFDQLGDSRNSIPAVSIDMSGEYQRAIRAASPDAEICFDPFDVCRLGSRDRPGSPRQVERPRPLAHPHRPLGQGHALVPCSRRPSARASAALHEVSRVNHRLYRAFLVREEPRLLYHLPDPRLAPAHLDAWLAWAARSRLVPFVALARTLRAHRDGILAAIRLGLSNARLEGLNNVI